MYLYHVAELKMKIKFTKKYEITKSKVCIQLLLRKELQENGELKVREFRFLFI